MWIAHPTTHDKPLSVHLEGSTHLRAHCDGTHKCCYEDNKEQCVLIKDRHKKIYFEIRDRYNIQPFYGLAMKFVTEGGDVNTEKQIDKETNKIIETTWDIIINPDKEKGKIYFHTQKPNKTNQIDETDLYEFKYKDYKFQTMKDKQLHVSIAVEVKKLCDGAGADSGKQFVCGIRVGVLFKDHWRGAIPMKLIDTYKRVASHPGEECKAPSLEWTQDPIIYVNTGRTAGSFSGEGPVKTPLKGPDCLTKGIKEYLRARAE